MRRRRCGRMGLGRGILETEMVGEMKGGRREGPGEEVDVEVQVGVG